MKHEKMSVVRKICLFAGILLIAAAAVLMILWQYSIRSSVKQTEEYVQTIQSLLPNPQNAVLEERRDNDMAHLSVNGTDFAGLLEMPRYDSVLPVCAEWGRLTKYPCCFDGSVYDGTLQIGAASQKGQYDFYREISVGDAVYFTDMEGNRYSFTVTDMHYEKHADKTALNRLDADLTLFIKNLYAFEYIIIFCDASA